jgi:hypothetical protein
VLRSGFRAGGARPQRAPCAVKRERAALLHARICAGLSPAAVLPKHTRRACFKQALAAIIASVDARLARRARAASPPLLEVVVAALPVHAEQAEQADQLAQLEAAASVGVTQANSDAEHTDANTMERTPLSSPGAGSPARSGSNGGGGSGGSNSHGGAAGESDERSHGHGTLLHAAVTPLQAAMVFCSDVASHLGECDLRRTADARMGLLVRLHGSDALPDEEQFCFSVLLHLQSCPHAALQSLAATRYAILSSLP